MFTSVYIIYFLFNVAMEGVEWGEEGQADGEGGLGLGDLVGNEAELGDVREEDGAGVVDRVGFRGGRGGGTSGWRWGAQHEPQHFLFLLTKLKMGPTVTSAHGQWLGGGWFRDM